MGETRLDRRLWVLFFGRLITSTGHSISFPFFAIYSHTVLGISLPWIGAAIFTSGLMGAFGKFLGGMLADRLGRKPVMLLALAGRACATAAFGALALQASPPWFAMAALFIAGNWFGFFYDPAVQAMVADVADERMRVAGYSLLRVGGNLGWAIGAIAGGVIGASSYAAMFFTTAGVLLAAFGLVATLIAESLRRVRRDVPRAPVLDCFRTPGFGLFLVATLLTCVMMSQLIAPLSVYATGSLGLSARQAGFLFALNGFVIVLFQFPIARRIQRVRLTSALVAGAFTYAAGYAAVGGARGFWSLAACVFVVSCGELLVAPSQISLAANVAPPDRRGRYLGVYGFAEMLGRSLGPLLGTVALERFASRPWMHWTIIGAVGCAAGLGFLFVRSRISPRADRPEG